MNTQQKKESPTKITVAHGDGIGPEIMDATLKILKAAGANIAIEEIEIGEKVYLDNVTSGIRESAWDSLRETKVFLKAPITTPQGGGYKSLNVTIRKTLGLFANVRPCRIYAPFVNSKHTYMDLVIIRENEEDLYAGIEHQQTDEVIQCLKLISRPGCEKIIRYAFEYARSFGRKKVTCMSKDNIMKLTDGMFHKIFNDIAKEYPDIAHDHRIIDIGSALIADKPASFDVIVTLNLYGDIISDIAAQVAGSVGLSGSSNIGEHCAMFEAIHGSAPDISGKNLANPSGLLNAAVMMLVHIGQPDIASLIENAWLKTLEDGIHTGDIASAEHTSKKVGTQEFADAIIKRLGQTPTRLTPVHYNKTEHLDLTRLSVKKAPAKKDLLGVDVFLHWDSATRNPDDLGRRLEALTPSDLRLKMITNRGVKVYPDGKPETFCTDHWRCRFVAAKPADASIQERTVSFKQILNLLSAVHEGGLDAVKTENLYAFDQAIAYSLGQGE
jgi:isocitrate dehydrogenase